MKSMAEYIKSVAFDFVLVLVASVSLEMVLLQGFVTDPNLQFNVVLLGGVSLVLQMTLYASAHRRKNFIPGAVAYALVAIVIIVVGVVTSTGENVMDDIEENHLALAVSLVLVNLAVFLLSRKRKGFFVLLAAGLFVCAYVQFVYRSNLTIASLVFVAASALLFVNRTYYESVLAADSIGKAAFGRAAVTAGASVALAASAAVALYLLVIVPLNPGHTTLKLFTEYRSFETVEVNNPVVIDEVEDPEQITTTLTDEVIYGKNPIEVDSEGLTEGATASYIEQSIEQVGTQDTYSLETTEEGVDLYTYELPEFWWLWVIAVVILLALAIIGARKLLRARRRKKIASLTPREQVAVIYNDLLKRFAKLGLGKIEGQTPYEFSVASQQRMEAFVQVKPTKGNAAAPQGEQAVQSVVASRGETASGATPQGEAISGMPANDGERSAQAAQPASDVTDHTADWFQVSDAYVKSHYGRCEPTAAQMKTCWCFYDGFCKAAMKMVGRPRYCLKYYWIL